MSAILEARGLTVGYGTLAVARELNLSVEPGRVMLILGPNGAGKTTTLMTLAGALRPLTGEVRLAGDLVTSPLHRRVQQGLAFVPDERGAITRLTLTRTSGSDRATPSVRSSCSPSFAIIASGEPACCRAASRRCSLSHSR